MKRILSLLIILMASGLAAAQLEDYAGFPKNIGTSIQADIIITSLDQSAQKDIIVVPENRELYVFRSDGSLRWKNVSGQKRSDYGRRPAVSDINGDGRQEIITYGNPGVHYAHVYIWGSGGDLMTDIAVGENMILAPPSVVDIGEKIILVGVSPGNPPPASGATGVYAYSSSGSYLWYSDIGPVLRTAAIAVGNIDDDIREEAAVIVNNNNAGRLVVLEPETTGAVILWTKDIDARISGAAIDDVNNDGKNEIIIGSGNGVFVWDGNGSIVWSNSAPSVTHSSPSIGDIDGNGVKDVVIGSDQQKLLFAISMGDMMPGFPVSTVMSVWSKPALQDMNGDGKHEIIAGDFGGYLYGWNYTGSALHGFPVQPSPEGFMSSPAVSDLAGTGKFQIVAGNDDGRIYAYTYNSTYDPEAPVTTDDADGLWHNSTVTVTLSAEDARSGVAATYYTIDGSIPTTASPMGTTITITDDGIYTIRYFSVDNAGNVEPVKNAVVKIDITPPVTSDDSDKLWHNNDVVLNLAVFDALSGAAVLYYKVDGIENASAGNLSLVFKNEGVHAVEYYGVDNAGNAEPVKTATVKIDRTPPSTADDADGAWHNSTVIVTLTATDALSGVNATYFRAVSGTQTWIDSFFSWISEVLGLGSGSSQGGEVIIADEGVFSIYYYSTDNAGNTEAEKVSRDVKVDKTQPSLTIRVPANKTYLHSDIITLSFTASDALSGLRGMNSIIDADRQVSDGQTFDMLSLNFGAHEFSIAAEDNATNINAQKVGFEVIATIDSLIALNGRAVSSGWINDSGPGNSLEAKLNSARQSIDAGQNSTARNVLEAYISDVLAQSGVHITPEGANVLISEARYVIDHLQGMNTSISGQADQQGRK